VQSVLEVVIAASDVPRPLHRDECVGAVRLVRGITRIADDGQVRKVLDALITSTLLEERGSGIQLLHASFYEYLCAGGSAVSIDCRMGHRALAGYALLAAESAAIVPDESSDDSSDEGGTGVDVEAWTRVVEWMVPLDDGTGARDASAVRLLGSFACGDRPKEATPAVVSIHVERARRPAVGITAKEPFPTDLLDRLLSLSRDTVGDSLAVLAGRGELRLVKRYVGAATNAGVLAASNAEKALVTAVGHIGVIEFLLGLEWDKSYVGLGNALYAASQLGHLESVTALFKAGADARVVCDDGWTPLHVASAAGHLDVVKALLNDDPNADPFDDYERTPLHLASLGGHLDVVTTLLKADADLKVTDEREFTPLHMASMNGNSDVVKALLDAEADVNAVAVSGILPLYLASAQGHLDVVKALLAAEVDAEAVSPKKFTVLVIAANNRHFDVVKAMLDAGVSLEAAETDGRTLLHMVLQALLDAGADATAVD
jgi:ankyrin repeat protein